MATRPQINGPLGLLGLLWGIGGPVLLLGEAVYSLSRIAAEAFAMPLTAVHWSFLGPWLLFMGYSEGYRGFQKGYAPRIVLRALHLAAHPRVGWVVGAPFFTMGFIHATKKRKIVAYCLVLGIAALVIGVRLLPQPWRGLVDAGVVLGLGWGLTSLLAYTFRAMSGHTPPGNPYFPEDAQETDHPEVGALPTS